jgi:hypothetical protein
MSLRPLNQTSSGASVRLASTIERMPRDARADRRMRAQAVVASIVGLALAIVNYVM